MKKNAFMKMVAALVMLLASTTMYGKAQYLLITPKSGEAIEISLAEYPVLLVEDGMLKVAATSVIYLEIPITEIVNYKLTFPAESSKQTDATAIESIKQGTAKFSGLKPGTLIRVYSVNGQQEGQFVVGESGNVTTELGAFGKGVHILRTPSTSIKVLNK